MTKRNLQRNSQSGYALFTSILLTGTLIIIAYATTNFSLKQLLLATSGAESHAAFYVADTGVECALYWDVKNGAISAFGPNSPAATITCGGAAASVTSTSGGVVLSNQALAGTVTSSGAINGDFPDDAVNNGERRGVGWASGDGGWNDNTINSWANDWVAIALAAPRNIAEIDVYTLADNFPLGSDPGSGDIFTQYGITDFNVQYSTNNGGSWSTVPGGSISGNNLIWRKITFTPILGVTNVRVQVTGSLQSYSRIVEIEVWGSADAVSNISTFQIPVGSSCAIVTVTKSEVNTTIESKGYNTCSGSNRLERAIRITY